MALTLVTSLIPENSKMNFDMNQAWFTSLESEIVYFWVDSHASGDDEYCQK